MSVNFENRKSEQGMTLIELIMVVVILAMLVAALGLGLRGKLGQSREKIAQITLAQIEGALDLYMIEVGNYPNAGEGLEVLLQNPGNAINWTPYLKKEPLDPWGHPFVYRFPGQNGLDYDLCSNGTDETESTDDDICNWK